MTNYPFEEIEQKEFNLKFSFEMLTSTIMFIQKVKSLYPGENNPVNINCTNLEDEIVDQLIEEDLDTLNSYFKRISCCLIIYLNPYEINLKLNLLLLFYP